MTATTTEPTQATATLHAQDANRALRMFLASAAERVFESGALLNRIQEGGLFRELAYDSFEGYLAALRAEGMIARSTAYANMNIARTFDRAKQAEIGIGRLRKLVDVPGALAIIEEGLEVPDGAGGVVRKQVTAFKCRELEKALRPFKERNKAFAAPVTAGPPSNEVYDAIRSLTSGTNVKSSGPEAELVAGPNPELDRLMGTDLEQPDELGRMPVPDATDPRTSSPPVEGIDETGAVEAAPLERPRRPSFGGQRPFAGDDDDDDYLHRTLSGVKRRGTPSNVA